MQLLLFLWLPLFTAVKADDSSSASCGFESAPVDSKVRAVMAWYMIHHRKMVSDGDDALAKICFQRATAEYPTMAAAMDFNQWWDSPRISHLERDAETGLWPYMREPPGSKARARAALSTLMEAISRKPADMALVRSIAQEFDGIGYANPVHFDFWWAWYQSGHDLLLTDPASGRYFYETMPRESYERAQMARDTLFEAAKRGDLVALDRVADEYEGLLNVRYDEFDAWWQQNSPRSAGGLSSQR